MCVCKREREREERPSFDNAHKGFISAVITKFSRWQSCEGELHFFVIFRGKCVNFIVDDSTLICHKGLLEKKEICQILNPSKEIFCTNQYSYEGEIRFDGGCIN